MDLDEITALSLLIESGEQSGKATLERAAATMQLVLIREMGEAL